MAVFVKYVFWAYGDLNSGMVWVYVVN